MPFMWILSFNIKIGGTMTEEQELYSLKVVQLKQILDLSPNLSDKTKETIKKIIRIKKEGRK